MGFRLTLSLLPLVALALGSGLLATYIWRLRRTVGALALFLLMAVITIWEIVFILQIASVDLAAKIFWNHATLMLVAVVPLLWLLFAIDYTGQRAWITRPRIAFLSIVPALTIVVILTNNFHHLFWVREVIVQEGDLFVLTAQNGLWFWGVHAVYSYVLLLIGAILIVRALLRWPAQYRAQMILVLLAVAVPWIANILTVFSLVPIKIDLTPFAFAITGLGMAYAMFRHRLLDLVPVARDIVIDGMSDGMLVLDANRRVVDINPAAQEVLDLLEIVEPIGKPIREVLARFPHILERYRGVIEGDDEIVIGEAEARRWFELHFSPLKDEGENAVGQVIIIHDITALKQTQEALLEARDHALAASRTKSQLLAKVSHELRTPLGGVLGYAELLQENAFGALNDEQKRAATEIIGSAKYLNQMVNELLDEAQIEAGTIQLNKKLFAPSEFLRQATSVVSVTARKKGLTFNASYAPDMPPALLGDERRLTQILINLTANAIKFTKEGTVTVSLQCPDAEHWSIRVADTGMGIPKESQLYIFEPFRQADNAITHENRGIGLGLSITLQLVQLMGGRIALDSEVGRGSTFDVILPIERPSA